LGVLVEGAAGAGTDQALQRVLRDVADGLQAVLAQQRRGRPAHAGQFPYGPGPQERCVSSALEPTVNQVWRDVPGRFQVPVWSRTSATPGSGPHGLNTWARSVRAMTW
jgi:hypothetical protein